jgi:hypothetical protein
MHFSQGCNETSQQALYYRYNSYNHQSTNYVDALIYNDSAEAYTIIKYHMCHYGQLDV